MKNLSQKLENLGFKKFKIVTYSTDKTKLSFQIVYYKNEDTELVAKFRKTWHVQTVYFVSDSMFWVVHKECVK